MKIQAKNLLNGHILVKKRSFVLNRQFEHFIFRLKILRKISQEVELCKEASKELSLKMLSKVTTILFITIILVTLATSEENIKKIDSAFVLEDARLLKDTQSYYLRVKIDFKGLLVDLKATMGMIHKLQVIPEDIHQSLGQLLDLVHELMGLKAKSRTKRSALAILSLGLGVYNRMDLSSVHSTLRKLNENQVKVGQNLKILDAEITVNSKAINASMDAIDRLFDMNALVQEEIKEVRAGILLQKDLDKLKSMVEAIKKAKRVNHWRDSILDESIIKHLDNLKKAIRKQGYHLIDQPLDIVPVSAMALPDGRIELLFHYRVYQEAWKVYQYVHMGSGVKITESMLAMDDSESSWLALSKDQWDNCLMTSEGKYCPNMN